MPSLLFVTAEIVWRSFLSQDSGGRISTRGLKKQRSYCALSAAASTCSLMNGLFEKPDANLNCYLAWLTHYNQLSNALAQGAFESPRLLYFRERKGP